MVQEYQYIQPPESPCPLDSYAAAGGRDGRSPSQRGSVCRHPPDRDGEERHLVGGTRPPSRGQAADGLGREAQDHGGDGAARGGSDGALTGRVEMDDAYLGGVRCHGGKRGRGSRNSTC